MPSSPEYQRARYRKLRTKLLFYIRRSDYPEWLPFGRKPARLGEVMDAMNKYAAPLEPGQAYLIASKTKSGMFVIHTEKHNQNWRLY